jgi:HEAT repeat protein
MRNRATFGGMKGLFRHLVTLSPCHLVILVLLACGGCGNKKSTDELIQDLKSNEEGDRIKAARLLQQRTGDPEKVIPALIESLKDKGSDIRISAAIGLGYFGEQAKDAIPALQAAQSDRDARVREAAGKALSRIDPARFPATTKARPAPGK